MISKILLLLIIVCLALYGLFAQLSAEAASVLNVMIKVANYTIEVPMFLCIAFIAFIVLFLRLSIWILNIPYQRIRLRSWHKQEHLLKDMSDCLLQLLSGELDEAEKTIRHLQNNEHDVTLMQAMLCDESSCNTEALQKYEAIAFNIQSPEYERLIATKRAMNLYPSWRTPNSDRVNDLLTIAERLTQRDWVLRSRFSFYLQNREWHKALEMVEYSFFRRRQKNITIADLRIKALLYCAIASDYENMGNITDAEKYWARALKLSDSNNIDIGIMHCDFLRRQDKLSESNLNKIFSLFPKSWMVTRQYFLLIPSMTAKEKKDLGDFLDNIKPKDNEGHYRDLIKVLVSSNEVTGVRSALLEIMERDQFGNESAINCSIATIGRIICNLANEDNILTEFIAAISKLSSPLVCNACMSTSRTLTVTCEQCGELGSKNIVA